MVGRWNRIPREAVTAPRQTKLKKRLDNILGHTVWLLGMVLHTVWLLGTVLCFLARLPSL